MIHMVLHGVVVTLAVLLAARIVPGIRVKSLGSAIVFALVLGVLNFFLRKALIVLALPLVLLSMGLFLIVINAFLFWLADKLVKGVEVDGFLSAVGGSLVVSAISIASGILLHV
jgi:putative membrane protein